MYVDHPLIRSSSIEDREYQKNISESCLHSSTLVVLPTGMGKTVIALRVIADVLQRKGGKILFLAPTKPLVEQHASFLRQHLVAKRVAIMTGEKSPRDRRMEWAVHHVIVSTPQVIANDLKNERISLKDVNLIIFDEAHRAVGSYAYVRVAEAYKERGLMLGITASPGSTKKRIEAVCSNLSIQNLELREESDNDVAPYIHDVETDLTEVVVPDETKEVADLLGSLFESYIEKLVNMRVMSANRPPTILYLLEVGRGLQNRLRSGRNKGYVFRALSLQAMALKVAHALELAETQSVVALQNYIEKLKSEAGSKKGSKAAKAIIRSPEFELIEALLRNMGEEHPKMMAVKEVVEEQISSKSDSKVMVFTNYRDSCEAVAKCLSQIEGAQVSKLVGQQDRYEDKGLNQKEQVEVLSKFKRGELNTVVATCVGEEGLDVANTDLVVFYEPVPSEIRSIQRRGRTGRNRPGKVVILVTKETKDERSNFYSNRKEEAMKKQILRIKKQWENERSSEMVPHQIMNA